MVLCMLFGIKYSLCSMPLRFGRRHLLCALSQDEKAKFQMPTAIEIADFQTSIRAKYSLLQNVYCVADGFKLYLEQSGDAVPQNVFYNEWTHDKYVWQYFCLRP